MQNDKAYDLLIIGAGPAGTAAALTFKQYAPDCSIAILENSSTPKRMIESLNPGANSLLMQLGIWEDFLKEEHPSAYGSSAAWGTSEVSEHEFIFQMKGNGWHLDRTLFDQFLRDKSIEKGIQIKNGCRYIGHKRLGNTWQVLVEKGDEKRTLFAKFVIDASGRNAAFAKREGVRKIKHDQLLGIYACFKPQSSKTFQHNYTLVESTATGWWYSALAADDTWVLAWMSDADLIKKEDVEKADGFLNQLSKSIHTKDRVAGYRLESKLQIFPAASFQLETPGGQAWVATGDAACTFDPLSSSGLFKGLRTGILSAYVAMDYFKGKGKEGLQKYSGMLQAEYKGYLETRKEYYQEETRWPESPFWRRRQVTKEQHQIGRLLFT